VPLTVLRYLCLLLWSLFSSGFGNQNCTIVCTLSLGPIPANQPLTRFSAPSGLCSFDSSSLSSSSSSSILTPISGALSPVARISAYSFPNFGFFFDLGRPGTPLGRAWDGPERADHPMFTAFGTAGRLPETMGICMPLRFVLALVVVLLWGMSRPRLAILLNLRTRSFRCWFFPKSFFSGFFPKSFFSGSFPFSFSASRERALIF
jgi:hypothetical protein